MNELKKYLEDFIEKKIYEILEKVLPKTEPKQNSQYAYSYNEVAAHLGCSKATVCRWKAEGKFKGCYQQLDRTVIFDLNAIDKKFKK